MRVPMCYHSMPETFYAELIHMFFAKLVVDLTPSDARFAWAALRSRIGYCGLANNEEHAEAMRRQLRSMMFKGMTDQNSGVYNAAYAAAVEQEATVPTPKAKAKAKADPKPKPEPKPKPKAKAKAKVEPKPTEDPDNLAEDDQVSADQDEVWDPLADLDE